MERTDKLLAMLPQGTAALLHNASNIFYLSAYTGEGLLLVASGIRAVITDFRYVEAAQKQCPGFTVHSIRAGVPCGSIASNLSVRSMHVPHYHLAIRICHMRFYHI